MASSTSTMSTSTASRPSQNLFEVYLRLRPSSGSSTSGGERFLNVEEQDTDNDAPRHITLNPPNDRRRSVEKFAFTQVFEEDATQLDVFHCTGVANLVEGVLAPYGGDGTDALLATLGVTGSGKTHTILGSRTQRGMIQLALDVIFRSLGEDLLDCTSHPTLEQSITNSDASEAIILAASAFIDAVYADAPPAPAVAPTFFKSSSNRAPTPLLSEPAGPTPSSRQLRRPSTFPQSPDVSALTVSCDPSSEYSIVVSMYEVYNDRIFDLLTPPTKSTSTKDYRRRPLLFKFTENSPDRKIVAGLRKVICGTLQEALLVLEAGLHERRVAGTGSNSVSSRSHGFFCVEVKKRTKTSRRHHDLHWGGSTLTIVDLAGSERARDAKTAGATLAEAGKINESLMYLGQCLQMQSDAITKDSSSSNNNNNNKPNVVPFRQCKLTELLFSNSFPSVSSGSSSATAAARHHRNPQKAVMVVTADPLGDYNSTSQILRYSALAREVTVPRIPSISQTIQSGTAPHQPQRPPTSSSTGSSSVESPTLRTTHHYQYNSTSSRRISPPSHPHQSLLSSTQTYRTNMSPPGSATFHSPPPDMHRTTMELAALEIARLSEELDYTRQALEAERSAREEAESHLLSMEDKMIELEQAIREDCTAEFERRLDIEMARWRATMQVEMERGEEHWGRKIEVFERMSFGHNQLQTESSEEEEEDYADGDEDKENVYVKDEDEDLEIEMDRLRRENEVLRRELICLSPSRRRVQPLGERAGGGGGSDIDINVNGRDGLRGKLESLRVDDDEPSTSNGSGKRVRKLGGRRWNGGVKLDDDVDVDDDDDDMF
ncbi:P-loop containing nucleoside triphosphate hydrolase protein [Cladorrhinum sp. PSN259]|nr:P-loop containing nucleoside triphosphate hydrolase protein [Cladorrhinum sp. PSN259]